MKYGAILAERRAFRRIISNSKTKSGKCSTIIRERRPGPSTAKVQARRSTKMAPHALPLLRLDLLFNVLGSCGPDIRLVHILAGLKLLMSHR